MRLDLIRVPIEIVPLSRCNASLVSHILQVKISSDSDSDSDSKVHASLDILCIIRTGRGLGSEKAQLRMT